VTFAQCLTCHSSWARGSLYVLAQLLGAVFGALLQVRTHLPMLSALTTHRVSLQNMWLRTRHRRRLRVLTLS